MKSILALTDHNLYVALADEKMSYFIDAIEATIEKDQSIEYVKLGCDFCSKLFNAIDIDKFLYLCNYIISKRLKLIVAIPTIKAADANSFDMIKTIANFLEPIIWQVNDFGTFYFIKKLSNKNLVCAGRLFDRRVRDIRINKYEESNGLLPNFQYIGYLKTLQKFGFCGASIDNYKLDTLIFNRIKDFFLIVNENVVLSVTGRDCTQNCNHDCAIERISKFDEECFVFGNALIWENKKRYNLDKFDFIEKSLSL